MIGEVHLCDHRELAARLTAAGQMVDAVICDPPYSDRTHASYRDQKDLGRSAIDYAAWSPADVAEFVGMWSPLTRGWFVALTDHVLAPAWEAALAAGGRYVFSPVACVEPGRSVRLTGDGPGQWTCWAIAARPRTAEAAAWGALPGAYVVPAGFGRSSHSGQHNGVTGGKPLWLMRQLVAHYSRPSDLVSDPTCGAATTLVAAKMSGRRFVGSDIDAEHVAIARKRLDATVPCDARGTPIGGARGQSLALFGGGT